MSSILWHLYFIRTASGMLYTGITTDVQRRLEQHQRGGGAKSLRGKGPLTLVFQRPAGDRSRALRWEYRVKQLSRGQKSALSPCRNRRWNASSCSLARHPCAILGWKPACISALNAHAGRAAGGRQDCQPGLMARS